MKLTGTVKREWPQILILIAPFVIIAFVYNKLPQSIPVHWDIHGQVNRYGDKSTDIFLLPLINIGLAFAIGYIARFDPKAARFNFSESSMRTIRLIVTAFLFLVFIGTILSAMGSNINMGNLSQYGLMLFLLVLGNFLPKIKPNYFIGVRTPWTLEDPENWRLTHQFAGRLWVIASAVGLLLEVLLPSELRGKLFSVYLGVVIVPPIVYSFWIFQKQKKQPSTTV